MYICSIRYKFRRKCSIEDWRLVLKFCFHETLTLQARTPQNGHTWTIRRLLPTNCLSVFDDFVGLALKGLKTFKYNLSKNTIYSNFHFLSMITGVDSILSITLNLLWAMMIELSQIYLLSLMTTLPRLFSSEFYTSVFEPEKENLFFQKSKICYLIIG